jgi:hypothetical protein
VTGPLLNPQAGVNLEPLVGRLRQRFVSTLDHAEAADLSQSRRFHPRHIAFTSQKVIMFNTNGLVVEAQGIDASMRYYLDPYFNFSPPLKFAKLRLQASGGP